MIQEFPLGPWMPDRADYKNPGLTYCNNCYPSPGGYSPFRLPAGVGDTVAGDIRGARRFERSSGVIVVVVGTATDLHVVVNGTVTASSLGLSLGSDIYWSFEQFGKQIWAFAYGQEPHYLTNVDTDATFSAHPGDAPKAATVNRIGDFLVTANMEDIDGSTAPYRVRWSQFNNPAGDYGTDIATQSGFQDLPPKFGPVMSISGGERDVILQKYGISRMTYTGGAAAFRLDVIEEQRGCLSRLSVAVVGGWIYFLGNDGFCRTDGNGVEVISAGKVWDWFLANADAARMEFVRGAVDWREQCIVWAFTTSEAGSGYTRQIIYSWAEDRWSTASVTVDWLFDYTEPGLSLEQVAAAYPNLDSLNISLDSPDFRSKDRGLAAIVDGEICNMTGDTASPQWETGDFQPEPGRRSCISALWPLIENQNVNTAVAVGSRATYKGDPVSWSADKTVGSTGFAAIIKDGRYHRARMSIPQGAAWDKAVGLQVEFNVTGRA